MYLYIHKVDPASKLELSIVSFYMLCFPCQQGNETCFILFIVQSAKF